MKARASLALVTYLLAGAFAFAQTPTQTPEPRSADLDPTGYVDMMDLFIIAQEWSQTTSPENQQVGDINGNNRCGPEDLLFLLSVWNKPTIPAPVLLSIQPDHGPPGTLITFTVADAESLAGSGYAQFGETTLPLVSVNGNQATSLAPALEVGPASASLVMAHQASNSLAFQVEDLPDPGRPAGEISTGVAQSAHELGVVLNNVVGLLASKGSLGRDKAAQIQSSLDRVNLFLNEVVVEVGNMDAEEKRLTDGILLSAGISDLFGVTGTGSKLRDMTDQVVEAVSNKDEFDEFRFRVALDTLSFTLSTIVKPALVVVGISTGGVPLLLAVGIDVIDTAIDGFISTDLISLHIHIAPDSPPGLNVGETASLTFTGDFAPQSNASSASLQTALISVVRIASRGVDLNQLLNFLASIAIRAGIEIGEDIFETAEPEPAVLGIPVDIDYYDQNLVGLFELMTGQFPSLSALLSPARLLEMFFDLGYEDIAIHPLLSVRPNVFTYDPAIHRVQAVSPGVVDATGFESHVWRMAKVDNPLRLLGIEWMKAVTIQLSSLTVQQPPIGDIITIPLPNLPPDARPLRLVRIPAGSFLMGNTGTTRDGNSSYELPRHTVDIGYDFYMGETEITQAQWKALMGSNPPTNLSPFYGVGNNYPVYYVSWNDCQSFNAALSARGEGTFRLPSEAEWEYACRGSASNPSRYAPFSFGDDQAIDLNTCNFSALFDQYMWWCGNAGLTTHPVRTKAANDYGLYDMHGNVWEWCQDNWHWNYSGAPANGSAWITYNILNDLRVVRGGSWGNNFTGWHCRSADRIPGLPDNFLYSGYFGLRVVRLP
jgi:formylglycine-generating enzyme required for sulfatase activity